MSRAGRWIAAGVDRTTPLIERGRTTVIGRLIDRVVAIEGRDRTLILAGQAFIALVPMLIVLATFLSRSDGQALGDGIISKFGLTGSAADAVDTLFERPPAAAGGLSIIGIIVLLVSLSSFARSLQRTFEAAWGLPRRGVRGTVDSFYGLCVLVALIGGIGWASYYVSRWPTGPVLTVALQIVVLVPGWVLISRLMLSRRVSARRLLPGAVLSAAVQLVASWWIAIWAPELMERNASRYGVIGVAFALVSLLVVLAAVVVGSAVAGAVLHADPDHDHEPGPAERLD